MKHLLFFISLLLTLTIVFSCKQKEVEGIKIEETLYLHQDYETNKELCDLILRTLNKEKEGLEQLIHFPCGGGAGCYDLGFIVTQILYKFGEEDFKNIVVKLDSTDKNILEGLLRVGLEYGYKNKTIENEFPDLAEELRK